MIYNYLLENETDKQEFARVQIKKLHPKKIHLNISINKISKDIVFLNMIQEIFPCSQLVTLTL